MLFPWQWTNKWENMFSCMLTTDQCVYWFCMSDLYSRLCEFCPLSEFLSGVDVWVMCSFKSLLQLFQLLSGEGGAAAPLLPLQGQVRLRLYIWTIICAVNWDEKKGTVGHLCVIMEWKHIKEFFVTVNWGVFIEISIKCEVKLIINWLYWHYLHFRSFLLLLKREDFAT